MDLINTILNIFLPPLTLILFFLFYPSYLFIKFFINVFKYLRFEDVAGKVVLITGASSGIGEHLAYEYAKKGAKLVLVARREDRLQIVAEKSRMLGSSDVIIIPGDVTKVNDCKKFIDETIHHFGKLDHLINNAGVVKPSLFEDYTKIEDTYYTMDVNFWGSTHVTYFAIPHLRKTKGKIIGITSISAKIPVPFASIYSASKAALVRFYEALRVEVNPEIKVTIVIPGLVSTEMTAPLSVETFGSELIIAESVSKCAKNIFKGIGRGENYIEEPSWIKSFYFFNNLCPDIIEYFNYLFRDTLKLHLKSK